MSSPFYIDGRPASFLAEGHGVDYAGEEGIGVSPIVLAAGGAVTSAIVSELVSDALRHRREATDPADHPTLDAIIREGATADDADSFGVAPLILGVAGALPLVFDGIGRVAAGIRQRNSERKEAEARARAAMRQVHSGARTIIAGDNMSELLMGADGQLYEGAPIDIDVDVDLPNPIAALLRALGIGPDRKDGPDAAPWIPGRQIPGQGRRHRRRQGPDAAPRIPGRQVPDFAPQVPGVQGPRRRRRHFGAEDFGAEDFGAEDFGAEDFGAEYPPALVAALRRLAASGWSYQASRNDPSVGVHGDAPDSGYMANIPMYASGSTNDRNVFTIPAGGTATAVTLTAEDMPYVKYQIRGFVAKISSSDNSMAMVEDLKVSGDSNIFVHENAVDARRYDTDMTNLVGLRKNPRVWSPMKATVSAFAVGNQNGIVTLTCGLISNIYADAQYGARAQLARV